MAEVVLADAVEFFFESGDGHGRPGQQFLIMLDLSPQQSVLCGVVSVLLFQLQRALLH